MEDRTGSRTPRSHRGGRSLIALVGRLPQWGRDLYLLHKDEASARALRIVLNCLRDLIVLLEARLTLLEAEEQRSGQEVREAV